MKQLHARIKAGALSLAYGQMKGNQMDMVYTLHELFDRSGGKPFKAIKVKLGLHDPLARVVMPLGSEVQVMEKVDGRLHGVIVSGDPGNEGKEIKSWFSNADQRIWKRK